MLRALAALLVLANVVFFVWARGWLSPFVPAPDAGEREPERLAAQVRPELVRIVSAAEAASIASAAAAAATPMCLEAGPFDDDAGIAGAEAALAAAGIASAAIARRDVQPPAAWLVYMGRYADAAALRSKQDELKRLKVPADELRTPAALAPGLALARHASRDAADAALAQLAQRGVHTARVVALPPPPAQHWLRAARADAALQAQLKAVDGAGAAFAPCSRSSS